MQLKWKKIWIISTLFVYFVSFFLQSNFLFFQTRAAEKNVPRVNIVAVLVDSKIYNWIRGGLNRYASEYIPSKLSDTKALVMPLDLDNISAYDIHRMLENVYFDWLENVNSSLIGLVMVWDIPLPVVNQDWYIFPTVYPYVDFEKQKYVWDSESKYFVPNGNIWGQAEIWHWLINYWNQIDAYNEFFVKIQNYVEDPDEFIWDSIWYEDIIASKEWFLDQSFPYYRNKIMFWEDIWYQRYSPLMRKMFSDESIDDSLEIVWELEWALGTTFEWTDSETVWLLKSQKESVHSSKLVEQEIKTSYLADYSEIFSKNNLSLMRENIFAWWRWIKNYENPDWDMVQVADADSSAAMIQLKDTMYLWNESIVWILQNLNDLMEEMIDEKIDKEKYSMDIVLPLWHKSITGKRILFKCYSFVDYYENFYFWENARNIESAKDLTVYRWTYRNLTDLEWLEYKDLLVWNNAVKSDYDKTDVKLKSIWASYDIFSNQVEWNRWYMMTRVDWDLDIYDDNKTAKKASTEWKSIIWLVRRKSWPEVCRDGAILKKNQCEEFGDFAKRWWWWASTINLITDSVATWRYALSGYKATDSWRTIYDMWWFQSLQQWKDEWMAGKWWIDWMWAWPQWAGNSFKAYIKYSSPTQREFRQKATWWYIIWENHTPEVHTGFKYLNYWDLRTTNPNVFNNWEFTKQSAKVFDIYYYPNERIKWCASTEKYSYKFISSIIKHDSTSLDEINWIEYDLYWDNWQLWKYYNDIKAAYTDLDDDMNDINVKTFPDLINTINSANNLIEDYISSLNSHTKDLDSNYDSRDDNNSHGNSLSATLPGLNATATSLEESCREEEAEYNSCVREANACEAQNDACSTAYYACLNACEDGAECECSDCSESCPVCYATYISTCNSASSARQKYNSTKSQMESYYAKANEHQKAWDRLENTLANLLSKLPELVEKEDKQVNDMYLLVMWLFAQNIISAIEYVANIEWIGQDDLYDGIPDSLKIWFLPVWIDDINKAHDKLLENKDKILSNYKSMYTLLEQQQSDWQTLSSFINSVSENGGNKAEAVRIAGLIEKVFEVEDDWNTVVLSPSSAVDELNSFIDDDKESLVETLAQVKKLFSNLVKVDSDWPQIVLAARQDTDFLRWVMKNAEKKWIDYSNISDWNLITLYALRAKWDWYESEVASWIQDVLRKVTKHMSWMNILTPDRPVDSPRYVSMQSVAWNEIKLIYPNLFKVEVFELTWVNKSGYDIHKLLGTWEIKEHLINYLTWKVDEYNKILKKEREGAGSEFTSKSQYYQKLMDFNKLATPTWDSSVRPYNYFTYDEFVEALWWEDMLDVIADILYYQSLTNKTKLSTWVVADDIELIKDSFNLNDKREQTLRDYLIEWNDNIMNPLLVIPNYEPYWYEVAFVNSNGKDYIIPSEIKEDSELQSILKSVDNSNWLNPRQQPSPQEEELNNECNIPANWRLPLFKLQWLKATSPWFDWFKCWLKHLKDSVKVKLTFNHSFWDVVVWSWFQAFMDSIWESYFSDTAESLVQWWDKMGKYTDDLNSLLSQWTWYNSDKNNTQLWVEAEKHNKEVLNWVDEVSNALLNLSRNLRIGNSSSRLASYQYTWSNPYSELKIESAVDVWRVNVSIVSTWDGCLQLDNHNLCNWYSFGFNPKTDPFTWLISSYDHIAWSSALDMKISIWWQYIEKVIKYTVNPWLLDHVEINIESEPTFAWMITPVEVVWYDLYNNRLSWTLDRYKFTSDKWKFLRDWAYNTWFITNDFRNLKFYYQAPVDAADNDVATIQIFKVSDDWDEPVETYQQPIAFATPEISIDWKVILSNWTIKNSYSMKLTDNEDIYQGDSLNVSKLHKIDVNMKNLKWDLVDIDSQIAVTSQNWLVVVWEVQKKEDWKQIFFETSRNYISGGHVTVYYYPTTVAWNDIISIDIPWLNLHTINLSIQPSKWSKTQIIPEKDIISMWDETYVEFFLSDVWWNLIHGQNPINVCYDNEKIEFIWYIPNDDGCIGVDTQEWYVKLDAVWTWWWVTFISADKWSLQITVDKNIFPHEFGEWSWLNIMYLNYFWNDWWNQWWYFSDNDNYIEKLMTWSIKLITTTTQLVSEDKIKKILWKIEPWFKIWNPGKLSTTLNIRWKQWTISAWWLSSMSFSLPDIDWRRVNEDTMYTIINNSKSSENFAFYFPSADSYSIKDGILYDWKKEIINLLNWNVSLQLLDYSMDNGDNVWNVIVKWVSYWRLVIHMPLFKVDINNFTLPSHRYVLSNTFINGSTDNLNSVWIFDGQSNFELQSTYKSIQNSDEIKENIWFLWDFKNITLFWEWEIVWEATKKFWSEFVINLWDPVLSRKWVNETIWETNFDWWIWQEIFSDSESQIYWTYQIDFNNDWKQDLLVVYLDWTVKLSKNYWWTPDLRNMQELMRIAVGIKQLYIWDVDGNKYDDIIIHTSNNQLRVYLNNWWIFDVDWYVVCLNLNAHNWEISSTPSDLSDVYNIFVEDMNQDKIVDIVTYDRRWYIKIFYGGNSNKLWWWNYLSTEKYWCDAWWYERESNGTNTQVITALWLSVVGDNVSDNSMLRWVWMWKELVITEDDLEKFWITFDEEMLSQPGMINTRDRGTDGSIDWVVHGIMDNFDTSKAAETLMNETTKFQEVTLYDTKLVWWDWWNTYTFAPVSYLDLNCWEDYWTSWKNYIWTWWKILSDGDIVTVRVTIQATHNFWWSYWDVIQWPRKLYYDEHNIMKWIRFVENQKNAVIKQKDWGFAFIVDNILLNAWERMVLEYDLEYHGTKLKNIDLTYDTWWSPGELPDIKIWSVDGCDKSFFAYVNGWGKQFTYTPVDLQSEISSIYDSEDNNTEDYAKHVIEAWSDVNQLPGIVPDKSERISLLWSLIFGEELEITDDEEWKKKLKNAMLQKIEKQWLESLNMNLNIDLSIFEDQSDEIEKVIDKVTQWMCNGFSFGWSNNCPWLPVPFNQAFLAPGKYHLFGCWDLPLEFLEWWIPAFFFPSSLPPYPVIPIPWWMKGAWDSFFWPLQWWNYPSLIRIYAVPTLTAQLWIGICFGPYATSKLFVSPIWDIAGNCIVFAVKPQCKSTWKESWSMPDDTYNPIVEDVRDSGVCLKTQKWPHWYNPSPFYFNSYSSQVTNSSDKGGFSWKDTWKAIWWGDGSFLENVYNNMDISWWRGANVEYATDVLWVFDLEVSPFIWEDDYNNTQNSIMVWDVDILWWTYSVNKIRWWIQQWIRKVIIDKWLDPQIRYIANQLTKMHVEVKMPDPSNLIDNEVQTIKDAIDEMGKESDTIEYSKSGWEWNSYQTLNKINDEIGNPFEQLASLMNKSNIINISIEPMTVKVPWIFAEDINAYSIYLNQWIDNNKQILDKWRNALNAFSWSCAKEPTLAQKQACYEKAQSYWSSFIQFEQVDWPRMVEQIYTNLRILQEYRDFPFEVYEWMHVIDRYMSEISSLINNTVWYLSYWVTTNAERYVGYVDAIVLILNIIKTYQLIIDFSVDWSETCGNCSRDTYDQYSCKLSMLCEGLQLPIIQIPNFKIPNITLDLTNIDLWLDIILPKFNFQTVKIDLPDFPNLPEPPSISANIKLFDLPDIPQLPEPPELPELPSFIPEIELELPVLPPAPEIPKLPNTIETTIKVAKLIWKIYCIVKWGFWLVWEKSVKAKVEQITQRTYSVNWIDNILNFTNRSAAPVNNYGVDYEISSYVDIQFNFSDFYDYLNILTKEINKYSTMPVDWWNEALDKASNWIYNATSDITNSIDGANININWTLIWMNDTDWKYNSLDANLALAESDMWLTSDEIEYVDYDAGKSRFKEVLAYFKSEVAGTTLSDEFDKSFKKIENQIETPNLIESNVEWLNKVKNDVLSYLNDQKSEYDALADLINTDYEWFLAMVESGGDSSDSDKLLTFNVQLFNLDSSTEEKIKNISKQNPYQILLENKQNIVDWYWNAINTNTADDLWLTRAQYLALRNNIWDMKQKVSTIYSFMKPASSTNLIAKNWGSTNKTLVASTKRLWWDMEMANSVDPAAFSDWIYEKDRWWLVKVVYSESFTSHIWKKLRKTSQSSNHDIILWDADAIYMKCQWQDCNVGWWRKTKFYEPKSVDVIGGKSYKWTTIKEIPYKETWIEFDNETRLKIADEMQEVKDWRVRGQSYDVLSFSWTLNGADAYLIKLLDRIDHSYEKVDYTSKEVLERYVLALPDWTDLKTLYKYKVKLELLKKTDLLEKLYWKEWKPVVEVVYYDPHKASANITISNIDRKWYFGRVVTLKFNSDENVYNINSPRSNQIVAWKQIVWDNQGPLAQQQLYRPSVSAIVSEWERLEWYVWTKYRLDVNWSDDVALDYISISQNGKILNEKYTSKVEDTISINIDIHTAAATDTYQLLWIDQFGNKTEKTVTVDYSIPDIQITDVLKSSDWKSVNVIAELSQDIDEWNVSFQRKRWESWRTMDVKPVVVGDTHILWGSYSAWTDIAMYDKDNSVMALMDPNTAEIKIQPGYEGLISIRVKVQDNTILELYNNDTKKVVFSIRVPIKELVKIEGDSYSVSSLPESWNMWIFNWWKAVYRKGETPILYISPTWHLFSELWMEWEYSYDRELQAAMFTLYKSSELHKKNPVKVWVKAEPFSAE